MEDARRLPIALALAVLSFGGCGGNGEYVNAPDWVIAAARQEAGRLDEESPKIAFAACGPSTCIVRMLGSFRNGDSRAPRLDLELNVQKHSIDERVFNYGA